MLAYWIFQNMWLRAGFFVAFGVFFWFIGDSEMREAAQYKKGAETVEVQNLGSRIEKYDYLSTKGFSNGDYIYLETKWTKNGVETGKSYVLYYPLLSRTEAQASTADGKLRPSLIVRQSLKDTSCMTSKANCLEAGLKEVKGRAAHQFETEDDLNAFKKLQESYAVDENTPVINADWEPTTAENASGSQGLGVFFLAIGLLSIPVTLFFQNRKSGRYKMAQ